VYETTHITNKIAALYDGQRRYRSLIVAALESAKRYGDRRLAG